ncbi:unnamed protein product, partial [Tuber aestivum]
MPPASDPPRMLRRQGNPSNRAGDSVQNCRMPAMFTAELERLAGTEVEQKEFNHIRTGIASGSSIPKELVKRFHRELDLTVEYATPKCRKCCVSAVTTTDDALEKRANSVSTLMVHIEAKVGSATDFTKTLSAGELSEVPVSGYLLQMGYWSDPIRTAGVRTENENGKLWIHGGDKAELDENGCTKCAGRLGGLIMRGGENIVGPLE